MTQYLTQTAIASLTGTSTPRVARTFRRLKVQPDGELLRGSTERPAPLYRADRIAELANVIKGAPR